MRDIYLRFTDVVEMRQESIASGFIDDEEQGALYHLDISLDIIGIITFIVEIKNQGEEGEIIKYKSLPGYHINLRVTDDSLELASLETFAVFPASLYRVWA